MRVLAVHIPVEPMETSSDSECSEWNAGGFGGGIDD